VGTELYSYTNISDNSQLGASPLGEELAQSPRGEAPFTCLYIQRSGEYLADYKRRYFCLKAFNGVSCGQAKGYRFRWFTLTESDEAIDSKKQFGKEFHGFIRWLRYYCPDFQYLVVEHRQGDLKRRNWHIVSYGSDKLPVAEMREYWIKHFKSTLTGMSEIRNIRKAILYLAGYLSDKEKFIRSYNSQGWVYPAWVGVSKTSKKEWGIYPTRDNNIDLSMMTPEQREQVPAVIAYRLKKTTFTFKEKAQRNHRYETIRV
jgi:hypothetical protein